MHTYEFRLSFLSISAFSLLLTLGTVMPVQAGFKWVGSDEVQSAKVSVAPQGPGTGGGTGVPVIITSPEGKTSVSVGASTPTSSQEAMADEGDIVRGFADNVPLTVALRQVLPASVGFSVAQDVGMGTIVSWRGGAPWRQVMQDMLMPAGLSMKEEGGRVHITRVAGGAPVAAAGSKPMTLLPTAGEALVAPANMPTPLAPASGVLTPPAGAMPLGYASAPVGYSGAMETASAWTAGKGEMLQKVLEAWSRRANVEVSWQAEYDYPLQASVSLNGSFEDAVRNLLAGFQEANPQPIGYLYTNQAAGQTVLVVQTRGNNYTE